MLGFAGAPDTAAQAEFAPPDPLCSVDQPIVVLLGRPRDQKVVVYDVLAVVSKVYPCLFFSSVYEFC